MERGESLVGTEPLESEKATIDPTRFIATVQSWSLEEAAGRKYSEHSRELKIRQHGTLAADYAEAIKLRKDDPIIEDYEQLGFAYRNSDAVLFNTLVRKIRKQIDHRAPGDTGTIAFEKTYNGYEPFYRSSIGYIWILVIACSSWLLSDTGSQALAPMTIQNPPQ